MDATARKLLSLTFAVLGICLWQPVSASPPPVVDCSQVLCDSTDQQLIDGYPMFDENNFDVVTDGFGRTRSFWVHIPDDYDTLGNDQKIPVIFAFHGLGQARDAMVDGKWGDYFDENVAFVIPLGEPDPCDSTGPATWMGPKTLDTVTAADPNCDPATQQIGPGPTYDPVTYWNASIPGTFADVTLVENLRNMLIDRFPQLNPNKMYATGYSAGGGITYTLLCYRSRLFRGFSVVAFNLLGDLQRGDFDDDGVEETDPDSLVATCGKTFFDAGHATGIMAPHLWGYGNTLVVNRGALYPQPSLPIVQIVPTRVTKPVALFVGDQDPVTPVDEINGTGSLIRDRNNLNGTFYILNPYSDTQADNSTTQRRTFVFPSDNSQPYAAFRRFFVQGVPSLSATHAMPDAEECLAGLFFMTCDYSYTTETTFPRITW